MNNNGLLYFGDGELYLVLQLKALMAARFEEDGRKNT
jgi:hypothetical protein